MHNLLFMKHGGPIEVAAYGIASYLIGFYYLLAEGVCGGMQPLVSYYYGARQPDKVRQVLKLGLMTAVGGGIALAVAILILPSLFTSIFISGDLDGVWRAMPLSNICLSIVVVLMLKRQLRRLGIRLTPKKESLAN